MGFACLVRAWYVLATGVFDVSAERVRDARAQGCYSREDHLSRRLRFFLPTQPFDSRADNTVVFCLACFALPACNSPLCWV